MLFVLFASLVVFSHSALCRKNAARPICLCLPCAKSFIDFLRLLLLLAVLLLLRFFCGLFFFPVSFILLILTLFSFKLTFFSNSSELFVDFFLYSSSSFPFLLFWPRSFTPFIFSSENYANRRKRSLHGNYLYYTADILLVLLLLVAFGLFGQHISLYYAAVIVIVYIHR